MLKLRAADNKDACRYSFEFSLASTQTQSTDDMSLKPLLLLWFFSFVLQYQRLGLNDPLNSFLPAFSFCIHDGTCFCFSLLVLSLTLPLSYNSCCKSLSKRIFIKYHFLTSSCLILFSSFLFSIGSNHGLIKGYIKIFIL